MLHILKTWPAEFSAVASGRKRFEIRLDDRARVFLEGDVLYLKEWNPTAPEDEADTGARIRVRVTYTLRGAAAERFGLKPGFVALGIDVLEIAIPLERALDPERGTMFDPSRHDCSWCGGEIDRSGRRWRSRRDEDFCSRAHRDASSAAVRRLVAREVERREPDAATCGDEPDDDKRRDET